MTAPVPNYAHWATFEGAHDGDTFTLRVDFGKFSSGVRLAIPLTIRLYGFDAWELGQPLGPAARDFTTATLAAAKRITVATIKPDGGPVGLEKYGRFLARVWVDDTELADLLRANGYEKRAV